MTLPQLPERMASKRSSKSAVSESMRNDGPDIQAGLQQDGHLVPGLVHLAAVDALNGEHVENHLPPVDAISLQGFPALRSVRHGPYCASMSRNAEGLPDISMATSKPSFMPSLFCTSAIDVCCDVHGQVAPTLLAKLQTIMD